MIKKLEDFPKRLHTAGLDRMEKNMPVAIMAYSPKLEKLILFIGK